MVDVAGEVSAEASRVPCGYAEGNRAKRGFWRGAVLLARLGRGKLLTCRFVENRRCLHRPVQKRLTARLPTAFKPAAATAAFFRFPTSPTGSAAIIVLSCLKKRENDFCIFAVK